MAFLETAMYIRIPTIKEMMSANGDRVIIVIRHRNIVNKQVSAA